MTVSYTNTAADLPFVRYPDGGRRLLGLVRGGNCRHGYGLTFMRLTGETSCAYCGLELSGDYLNWLQMALDHVIPRSTCLAWGIPEKWQEDHSNRVLSCTTCNTFGNRYHPVGLSAPAILDEFYDLRDRIYIERKALILKRHQDEREFFDRKLWVEHG